MPTLLRTIADSVAAGLQLATASEPLATVQRKNWAAIDVTEMEQPVIIVTPGGAETTRIGRGAWQNDFTVNVFIGRHVGTDGDVDEMLDLTDFVVEALKAHDWPQEVVWPADVKSPNSVTIEINPDDALSERNVWRAVVAVVYRNAVVV